MRVLENIMKESEGYYLSIKKKLEKEIDSLPEGSIKERKISGQLYYYHQSRLKEKIVHKYIGKDKPEKLIQQIDRRRQLQDELKKVEKALRMIRMSKGRKRD